MNRNECNLSLDELLKFDGVMAAGIFSPEAVLHQLDREII